MYFFSVSFKDSATPFAEALVELHHEIMFYLVVIVSVVIFMLVNAINITRVRESYFYVDIFSFVGFFKSLFLNSIFSSTFYKFLGSSYYLKFYLFWEQNLDKLLSFTMLNGFRYLSYVLKALLLVKEASFKLSFVFQRLELLVVKLLGDYRILAKDDIVPNSFNSNLFFYKARNSSSYLTYLFNLSSYLNILLASNDIEFKAFSENREVFYSYFRNLSKFNVEDINSKILVSSLDPITLNALYSSNLTINYGELNSHFSLYFINSLKNGFDRGNSLNIKYNKLLSINPSTSKSIYSFLDAQSHTVHNTKLEII